MTSRERWLAAIHMETVDRLPFWPKLFGSYPPAQKAPFSNMAIRDLHKWIGSDLHEFVPSCVKEVRKNSFKEVTIDGCTKRIVYGTKLGTAQAVYKYDKPSDAWHPVEMPIKSIEEIKLMTRWFSDCEVEPDEEGLEKCREIIKVTSENGVTAEEIGESPLMDFVEWYAGVENAHYFLTDYEEEVNELFYAMHDLLLKKTRIAAEYSQADLLYFVENTSTTLISPSQYCTYCFSHIQDYGSILDEAGKNLVLHMCGHLKALLPELSKIKAKAFEAFTSPTLGNTTLSDGRSACPDKCLIGGTNAVLWTMSPKEIISKLEEDLDALPHHRGLVITSAGVMPPLCKPETIKEVCGWIKGYSV